MGITETVTALDLVVGKVAVVLDCGGTFTGLTLTFVLFFAVGGGVGAKNSLVCAGTGGAGAVVCKVALTSEIKLGWTNNTLTNTHKY